jgi:anthranilate 1,2-dioxygenase large subunit
LDEQPIHWQRNDYSRVPNSVYHDRDLYELEMKRVFQGDAWLYLGMEAEVPKVNDFRTTWLGDVPVVFNRIADGSIHAFVNRCAHRGAIIRRELCGNAKSHVCVYHQWAYDQKGQLTGVPFQRGIGGEGGTSKEFKREEHPACKLRVESHHGVLFATFSDKAAPLADYLGPEIAGHIARVINGRRIRIVGYQRQTVRGNWKLYAENSRDQYHGSLLHKFLGTFLTKSTTQGGLTMDDRHRHSLVYSTPTKTFAQVNDAADLVHNIDEFNDPSVVKFIPEFGEDYPYGNAICSLFPNAVFQQIRNSLAARQVRPQGPDQFELFWTLFGFEEDSPELAQHRLLQVNMGGPAGFVASEDGEAIELVHKATASQPDSVSLLEMGGTGNIPTRVTTRMNELALRGFWSFYSELMNTEPQGAIR